MRRFLKIVFSRMTLVALAIIVQLLVSTTLPYALNYFYPEIFGKLYVQIDLIINLLGLIMMLVVINSKMIVEGKLIWVILFLMFPLLGLVIYRMFVWKKAPKKHRQFYVQVKEQVANINKKDAVENAEMKAKLGESYGQFEYIYKTNNLKTYQNSSVKFLNTGETFYKELLESLENAKKYIFMEYFIIERGRMWNSILEILKRKVKEGVEVRVMYDDLGTIHKLPNNYPKQLKKFGIKCVKFNSFVPIMSAVHNNRDHRKITVVDGKVGFMSGLNIADEYINVVQKYGYWKDTGVKIEGEAVSSMLLMFLQLYNVQTQKVEDYKEYLKDIKPVKSNGFVCPYGDGPRYFDEENVAENVYLNMINQAKDYIWITTPYLILDSKLTNALCSASKRGVDVRIITPHVPDKKIIFRITRSSYKTLQEAGVKIYEYSKGFVHSKQFLCDDKLAIVGTINLDYRSLLHHYECGVLMLDVDCLKDIKRDFDYMFTVSTNMKDFKTSAFNRLVCAILKAFTPML